MFMYSLLWMSRYNMLWSHGNWNQRERFKHHRAFIIDERIEWKVKREEEDGDDESNNKHIHNVKQNKVAVNENSIK